MDNTLSVKFKEEDCDDETKLYSKKCNKLLLKKELIEVLSFFSCFFIHFI